MGLADAVATSATLSQSGLSGRVLPSREAATAAGGTRGSTPDGALTGSKRNGNRCTGVGGLRKLHGRAVASLCAIVAGGFTAGVGDATGGVCSGDSQQSCSVVTVAGLITCRPCPEEGVRAVGLIADWAGPEQGVCPLGLITCWTGPEGGVRAVGLITVWAGPEEGVRPLGLGLPTRLANILLMIDDAMPTKRQLPSSQGGAGGTPSASARTACTSPRP